MALTEYNDMINAFPADRANEPFCVSVLSRRARGRRSMSDPRMIVSGLTIARALYAFGNDRQAVAKTSLSIVLKRRPFGAVRRSTLICCLSTSSSASRAARDRSRSVHAN